MVGHGKTGKETTMKKLITLAAVAALSLTGIADEYYLNPTNAEQFVANARYIAGGGTVRVNLIVAATLKATGQVAADVDAILSTSANPVVLNIYGKDVATFPKSTAAFMGAVSNTCPNLYAELAAVVNKTRVGVDVAAAAYIERIGLGNIGLSDNAINCIVDKVNRAAGKTIRHKFRSEGKAITEKDGVDPVRDAMSGIAAALNAPRMAGLRDAALAVGLDIPQPEFSFVPTAESVEGRAFIDRIYNGDASFNAANTGYLRYMLGTDGYNAFVERYNAGTR